MDNMKSAVLNPIEGLPVKEVINLLQMATGKTLLENQKYIAVIALEEYLDQSEAPTVRGVIDVLSNYDDLRAFAKIAEKVCLPR